MKNVRIPGEVKVFFPQCDLLEHPILNVELCNKTMHSTIKISSIQMPSCKKLTYLNTFEKVI